MTRLIRRAECLFALAICCAALASAQTPSRTQPARRTLRVLFVGNSLTSSNNLGGIVAALAASDTTGPLIAPTLTVRDGMTLGWHLSNGPAVDVIQASKWDYVVLQDQSLLGGEIVARRAVLGDTGLFFGAVRGFVAKIRAAGATPILFMTWARRPDVIDNAPEEQRQLAEAYQRIGRELDVRVAPAGLAWAEAGRRLESVDLYVSDGVHPSAAGSYLAACVIYSTLTGHSPIGRPTLANLSRATAAELQRAAWTVVSAQR